MMPHIFITIYFISLRESALAIYLFGHGVTHVHIKILR